MVNLEQAGVRIAQQDAVSFLRGMEPETLDLILTDPAYSGMNQHLKLGKGRIVGQYKERGPQGKWFEEFLDTEKNYGELLLECHRALKPNRGLFLMFDAYSMLTLGPIVRKFFDVKNIITWDKVAMGMGHNFRRQTEFVVFASKGRAPLSRRDIPDVWRIRRVKPVYPTQKPVELFETMIASCKPKGDASFLVCDPFLGCGSSAIAAIKREVQFSGCDISKKAVDTTLERIGTFLETGVDRLQVKSAASNLQDLKWLV
jgi:site-specific DNA-methyltransferase (adenine-specific)